MAVLEGLTILYFNKPFWYSSTLGLRLWARKLVLWVGHLPSINGSKINHLHPICSSKCHQKWCLNRARSKAWHNGVWSNSISLQMTKSYSSVVGHLPSTHVRPCVLCLHCKSKTRQKTLLDHVDLPLAVDIVLCNHWL